MTLTVPQVGEQVLLTNFLKKENQLLKLFSNNITPGETDTASTYTEANFKGYVSIVLEGNNWVINGTIPASATYANVSYFSSADGQSQNIYGYYVVQASSGILLWAERFSDGPYTISNFSDSIQVTPTITAD